MYMEPHTNGYSTIGARTLENNIQHNQHRLTEQLILIVVCMSLGMIKVCYMCVAVHERASALEGARGRGAEGRGGGRGPD